MLQLGRMSGRDFHHLCLDQWALLAPLCVHDVLQRRRLRAVVDKRTYYRNTVHVLMENKLDSSAVLIINRGKKAEADRLDIQAALTSQIFTREGQRRKNHKWQRVSMNKTRTLKPEASKWNSIIYSFVTFVCCGKDQRIAADAILLYTYVSRNVLQNSLQVHFSATELFTCHDQDTAVTNKIHTGLIIAYIFIDYSCLNAEKGLR